MRVAAPISWKGEGATGTLRLFVGALLLVSPWLLAVDSARAQRGADAVTPRKERRAPGSARPASRTQIPRELQGKLEYWKSLSPEERHRLSASYEQFKKLDERQRHRLRERGRRFLERWELIREHLAISDPDSLRTIEALAEPERTKCKLNLVREWWERDGQKLRTLLPGKRFEEILRLDPNARPRAFREALLDRSKRTAQRLVRWAQKRRRLSAEDVSRLQALPPAELHRALLAIRKEAVLEGLIKARDAGDRRIPEGVLQRLKALSPADFLSHYPRIQRRYRGGPRRMRLPGIPGHLLDRLGPRPRQLQRLEQLPEPQRQPALERIVRENLERHLRAEVDLDEAQRRALLERPLKEAVRECVQRGILPRSPEVPGKNGARRRRGAEKRSTSGRP